MRHWNLDLVVKRPKYRPSSAWFLFMQNVLPDICRPCTLLQQTQITLNLFTLNMSFWNTVSYIRIKIEIKSENSLLSSFIMFSQYQPTTGHRPLYSANIFGTAPFASNATLQIWRYRFVYYRYRLSFDNRPGGLATGLFAALDHYFVLLYIYIVMHF